MVNSKLPLHRVTDAANFVSSYAFTSGLTHGRNLELHVVGVIDAEVQIRASKNGTRSASVELLQQAGCNFVKVHTPYAG
jgi:maleate cis-trans isomerase